MTSAALLELIDDRTRLFRLSVRHYHRMLADGILEEGAPFELLDGNLVRKDRSAQGADPMTVGHDHAWAVKNLALLDTRLRRFGCHMQTQQPITLPPFDEPEPDGAIVRGVPDDYRDRHPGAKDVLCVIEVADASLRRDRTVKLRIYARSGITCYLIINLADRALELYSKPARPAGRYRESATFVVPQRLGLPLARGRKLTIPVRQLLP